MQLLRNKSKFVSLFALSLMLSFAISLFAVLPNVNAQVTKVADRGTGAFISTNPDLIGLNQPMTVNLWVYPSPNGPNFEIGAAITGFGGVQGLHFVNVTITFTRPDGSKDTFMPLHGSWEPLGLTPGVTDEVGSMWFNYEPNQVGIWSVSFSFAGQTFVAANYSVYYKPSTSRTLTFEVQEDKVQIGLPPVQLPTTYWARPINAENREWSSIGGDWLGTAAYGPSGIATGGPGNIYNNFNAYATAPNSAHVLWKTEAALGGLIGGSWGSLSYAGPNYGGAGGYGGSAPVIWNGRVFYSIPAMAGTSIICRDLRTGQMIWNRTGSFNVGQLSTAAISAVQEFAGAPLPYLWSYSATAGWIQYDAWQGSVVRTITTNIPNLGTPQCIDGNIAYVIRQGPWSGVTFRRPFNLLIKWNMSKVTGNNWLTGIVWNVTLDQPDGSGPGEGSRGSSIKVLPNAGIAVAQTPGESKFYAYSLDTGAQMWVHDIGFLDMYPFWSSDEKLIAYDSATMILHAYDVRTWTEKWAVQVGEDPWGNNRLTSATVVPAEGYGNIYLGGYDGRVYSVDSATGNINWNFYAGNTTETPFGTWATTNIVVGDGKVYFGTSEHSPTQPRTRGNKQFCIDAYTGENIWNISLAGRVPMGIADGCYIAFNEYDGYMYVFGMGKTETTVSAPLTATTRGQSLVLQGSVLDMSPASEGTPAISDADMSAWMNYLHMQRPEPLSSPQDDSWGTPVNVKGVEVSLDAIDPNNNFVHIATVTSDQSGLYSSMWTPDVPGKYTVIATFAGSESYWASYAETAVGVVEASAVTPPAEQVPTDFMPVYTAVIGVGIAIIVAIAIAVVLLLRKR